MLSSDIYLMDTSDGFAENSDGNDFNPEEGTSCSENGCEIGSDETDLDPQNIKEKYNLEYNFRKSSLVNRVVSEKRRKSPKSRKPKTKAPALSKYRRKAANSRERTRMREINDAFEDLKKVIPEISEEEGMKMTKITTLRLALNYIAALRNILGYEMYPVSDTNSSSASSVSTDDQCLSPTGEESSQSDAFSGLDSEGESFNR